MVSSLQGMGSTLNRHLLHRIRPTHAVLAGTFAFLSTTAQLKAAPNPPINKPYQQAKTEMPEDLYPYYRLLDRIMAANPGISQQATIGLRSLDESSCRKMLGDSAICAVASELPDISRQDHFVIWALQVAAATSGAPNA